MFSLYSQLFYPKSSFKYWSKFFFLPGNVILKIIYPCQIQDGEAGSPIYDELRIQGFNPTFLREGNEEEKDNVLVRNKWEMFK